MPSITSGVTDSQRDPADQVDVAEVVEGVREAEQPAVAPQQVAVDLLEVLVGLAADERLDAHGVVADGEDRVGDQPALAGHLDDDARRGAVGALVERVVELGFLEGGLDDVEGRIVGCRAPVALMPGSPVGSRTGGRCAARGTSAR